MQKERKSLTKVYKFHWEICENNALFAGITLRNTKENCLKQEIFFVLDGAGSAWRQMKGAGRY